MSRSMSHSRPESRVLLAALALATFAPASNEAIAGGIVYSFKLDNKTGASAYDYHLTLSNPNGLDAKTIKQDSSAINGKAWGLRPVDQVSKSTVTFGWSTNQQTPKNPLKNGDAGTFTFTVNNTNKVNVVRSQWSDQDGDPLGARTAAPTFTTKGIDPIFTFSNELEDSITFGIQNLQFEQNVPEIPPSSLDPDIDAAFNPNLPHFTLNPGDSVPFDVSGAIDPGNWDYSSGQVVDSSGAVIGAFIIGAQSLPEPASSVPMGIGVCVLAVLAWKKTRGGAGSRKGAARKGWPVLSHG